MVARASREAQARRPDRRVLRAGAQRPAEEPIRAGRRRGQSERAHLRPGHLGDREDGPIRVDEAPAFETARHLDGAVATAGDRPAEARTRHAAEEPLARGAALVDARPGDEASRRGPRSERARGGEGDGGVARAVEVRDRDAARRDAAVGQRHRQWERHRRDCGEAVGGGAQGLSSARGGGPQRQSDPTAFASRRRPSSSGVRIDSGWNCTAASGSRACSTAITTPSSLSAVTRSSLGSTSRSA